jgi:hypothetical protein
MDAAQRYEASAAAYIGVVGSILGLGILYFLVKYPDPRSFKWHSVRGLVCVCVCVFVVVCVYDCVGGCMCAYVCVTSLLCYTACACVWYACTHIHSLCVPPPPRAVPIDLHGLLRVSRNSAAAAARHDPHATQEGGERHGRLRGACVRV